MKKQLFGLTMIAALGAAGWAFAHSGATGIVKERMMAMKAIGGAMKGLSTLDWSDIQTARTAGTNHAETLRKHAAEMNSLFPEGSIKGPSEAITSIWERPDEFQEIADNLVTAAERLSVDFKTATSKADIAGPFAAAAATCKACHAEFRKKK